MDELADVAGVDPVEFRLAHLPDPRAAHVVETAYRLSGWTEPLPENIGRGIGFARYKEQRRLLRRHRRGGRGRPMCTCAA